MPDTHKVRVATANHAAALSLALVEVTAALGGVPSADLQELDGEDAVVDGVPTAAWASEDRRWTLGVPRLLADGSLRVAVARRGGYHARFTDIDVAAHLQLLGSAAA